SSGCLTGSGCFRSFPENFPRLGGIFLEPAAKNLTHHALDRLRRLGGNQFLLRLRTKLGIRHFDREYSRKSLTNVVARHRALLLAREITFRIGRQGSGQGGANAGEMCATIPLGNVV